MDSGENLKTQYSGDDMEKRFQSFLEKLMDVAKLKPRQHYLFPIMRGVPFNDMDVALSMALEKYAATKANDNGKK